MTSDQGTQIDLLAQGQEPEEERTRLEAADQERAGRRGNLGYAVVADCSREERATARWS